MKIKDQELDKTLPIKLGNMILYPIDSSVEKISENDELTGQLIIKDNRFVILGPRLRQDPEHNDPHSKESLN